jgi:hypothetical protein
MCLCVATEVKNSIKHIYETTSMAYAEGRRVGAAWRIAYVFAMGRMVW